MNNSFRYLCTGIFVGLMWANASTMNWFSFSVYCIAFFAGLATVIATEKFLIKDHI